MRNLRAPTTDIQGTPDPRMISETPLSQESSRNDQSCLDMTRMAQQIEKCPKVIVNYFVRSFLVIQPSVLIAHAQLRFVQLVLFLVTKPL